MTSSTATSVSTDSHVVDVLDDVNEGLQAGSTGQMGNLAARCGDADAGAEVVRVDYCCL